MKHLLLLSAFILSFYENLISQSAEDSWYQLPEGLGILNQLEYSFDVQRKLEILENWTNLDYSKGIFSAGLRLEVFQPNDPDPSIHRGKVYFADIAYKYLSVDLSNVDYGFKITVGNYYELFGRGMVLKSYEDRNIRVDNNLMGLKLNAHYDDLFLTALSGSAANSQNIREDIVHAVDLYYAGLSFLKPGFSYAINIPKNQNLGKTSLTSFRIEPSIWNFDFYFEFGAKQNQKIKNQFLSSDEKIIGKGFYGSSSFYFGPASVLAEYKIYDNFSFTSSDQTISYNTPPALRKEYTYLLLNRHPSALNPNNEKGFQIEVNYSFDDETNFQTNFGITESLNQNSYYQRINATNIPSQLQFKEFYFQANKIWGENFNSTFAIGYSEESSSKTKNLTPIIESKFYFDDINTIKIVLEHQQTENILTKEKYFSDVFSIEYLRSPSFNLILLTEMQTKEPTVGKMIRKFWSFIQVGYKISSHSDLSLLIGSRQAGNICIGGVCRFEPEFRGIELKMLTRI
jgi:hypothetical protein